ncbi:MAG: prolyl oligopeptidase family serine peptidase [Pseudomonadales bacterium]
MPSYPTTRRDDTIDEYFGTEIPDPYRWLEDDLSDETAQWVAAQNQLTFDYLASIPYRDEIRAKVAQMWDYPTESAPFQEGDYTYFYRNDGLQNQHVVYRRRNDVGTLEDDTQAEIFLDPNTFSNDGTTSLSVLTFSKSGKLAAYSVSEGGSDWRKIYVMDTETRDRTVITDVKFSGIAWRGNEGFYYSRYAKPEGSELSAKTDQHLLYYHKLGTQPSDDTLVFGDGGEEKRRYARGYVTEDDRYLVIAGAQSTSGNDLYIEDLSDPNAERVQIATDFDMDIDVVDADGDTIYAITNHQAPNRRLVKFSLQAPQNWQDVIPEQEAVLSVVTGGGYFFAHYLVDAASKVIQFDRSGAQIREIDLPDTGTAELHGGKQNATTLYYSFTNYRLPLTIYALDIEAGTSRVYRPTQANFASDQYESSQVFYTSKDGTQVPMTITHKKGLELDGSNPTILYGYGGFNISLTPAFSNAFAAWMALGGVYAVANLRGGGEYGKDWHSAGTLLNKQNVFDDFIAAAEYLIDTGYTRREHLALQGGSNGGLLVGATMTQRPDLAAVALPAVGVLDMLRYHTFTAGAGWAYDYGTSEQNVEMFEYLRGYSPLHNVKENCQYPATLVTTADHDDRVVPAHSFKFAAELQAKAAGPAPALIRIDVNAGHGLGTPISMIIDRVADQFSFTLYNMGFQQLPNAT